MKRLLHRVRLERKNEEVLHRVTLERKNEEALHRVRLERKNEEVLHRVRLERKNEEVLHRVRLERKILHTIKRSKANWIGHIVTTFSTAHYWRKERRKNISDGKTSNKTKAATGRP